MFVIVAHVLDDQHWRVLLMNSSRKELIMKGNKTIITWIIVFLIIILSLTGCRLREDPDYKNVETINGVPGYITKFVDEDEETVCYVYRQTGISCVERSQ